MISASVTAWILYREYLETLDLPLNSGLGICRFYFSTSAQISGSRLILRMKISSSRSRGLSLQSYFWDLCTNFHTTLIFTAVYFSLLNKSFRKTLTLSQGLKSAQLDDWQQQISWGCSEGALRVPLRSNDKICLYFWSNQSVHHVQPVVMSYSWRL